MSDFIETVRAAGASDNFTRIVKIGNASDIGNAVSVAALPTASASLKGLIYYLTTDNGLYKVNAAGDDWEKLDTAGLATWGAITGTLTNQTDLDTALGLKLVKASNLSDLANAGTARSNLGLGTAAVADLGTGAGDACEGNDGRLSDARTPTAHTHPLADVTDAGDSAGLDVGTTAGTVAAGDAAPNAHTHGLADISDAGTAAAVDTGTDIGDAVILEGIGSPPVAGMPAVDGSQLTGIVAGASAFTDLTDVPADYSGAGGYKVKVNAGENALEFVADTGGAGKLLDPVITCQMITDANQGGVDPTPLAVGDCWIVNNWATQATGDLVEAESLTGPVFRVLVSAASFTGNYGARVIVKGTGGGTFVNGQHVYTWTTPGAWVDTHTQGDGEAVVITADTISDLPSVLLSHLFVSDPDNGWTDQTALAASLAPTEFYATQTLAGNAYIANSLTSVFIVPAGKCTRTNFLIHNGNTSPEIITINFVLPTHSAEAKNVFFAQTVAGGETIDFDDAEFGFVAGTDIQMSTTTASKVSRTMSGKSVLAANCNFPVLVETKLLNTPMEVTYTATKAETVSLIAVHSIVDASEAVVINKVPAAGSPTLANELYKNALTLKETALYNNQFVMAINDTIQCSTAVDGNTNALIFTKAI